MPVINILQQGQEVKFNYTFTHSEFYSSRNFLSNKFDNAVILNLSHELVNPYGQVYNLFGKFLFPSGETEKSPIHRNLFDFEEGFWVTHNGFFGAHKNRNIKIINEEVERTNKPIAAFVSGQGFIKISKLIKHPEKDNMLFYLDGNGGKQRLPAFNNILVCSQDLVEIKR